jgi:hypothetical protein
LLANDLAMPVHVVGVALAMLVVKLSTDLGLPPGSGGPKRGYGAAGVPALVIGDMLESLDRDQVFDLVI